MAEVGGTAIVFVCVIFYYVERISGEVVELRVQPGDNIALQCNSETEVLLIEWHRICSHKHQPRLTISSKWAPPRFSITVNLSAKSSELRIENITESDLGMYYCTADVLYETSEKRTNIGKAFKVIFEDTIPSLGPPSCPLPECGQCWILLATLCPTCSILTAAISCTCVYCLLHGKGSKENELHQGSIDREESTKKNEDLCYASLDMPTDKHRPGPKKKRQLNTDFSAYSEVKLTVLETTGIVTLD